MTKYFKLCLYDDDYEQDKSYEQLTTMVNSIKSSNKPINVLIYECAKGTGFIGNCQYIITAIQNKCMSNSMTKFNNKLTFLNENDIDTEINNIILQSRKYHFWKECKRKDILLKKIKCSTKLLNPEELKNIPGIKKMTETSNEYLSTQNIQLDNCSDDRRLKIIKINDCTHALNELHQMSKDICEIYNEIREPFIDIVNIYELYVIAVNLSYDHKMIEEKSSHIKELLKHKLFSLINCNSFIIDNSCNINDDDFVKFLSSKDTFLVRDSIDIDTILSKVHKMMCTIHLYNEMLKKFYKLDIINKSAYIYYLGLMPNHISSMIGCVQKWLHAEQNGTKESILWQHRSENMSKDDCFNAWITGEKLVKTNQNTILSILISEENNMVFSNDEYLKESFDIFLILRNVKFPEK